MRSSENLIEQRWHDEFGECAGIVEQIQADP
jgi:hypothetical protein